MSSAIVIDPKDNVATALAPLGAGQTVSVEVGERREEVVLISDVPQGHKFALRDLPPGVPVLKYGEPIGESATDIARGEHVHVHNVVSRSRLASGDDRKTERG